MKNDNLHKMVSHILVPVKLDQANILIVKQAAEIAREHQAIIHLLYIEHGLFNVSRRWFPGLPGSRGIQAILKEKYNLMITWKRWLQHDYHIRVTCSVDCGNWKTITLRYAKMLDADMLVLNDQYYVKKWFADIIVSPVEYIIKKSECQVLTIFSKKESIAQWSHVVIPVTGFIPVARIFTIIRAAKTFNIKIHLISTSANERIRANREFHFLTESLKFIKHYGNVQVECRYVPNNLFSFIEYLKYARSIGADVLMTSNCNRGSTDLSF